MTEESVDSPPQAPGFQTLFNLDSWSPCFFFFLFPIPFSFLAHTLFCLLAKVPQT